MYGFSKFLLDSNHNFYIVYIRCLLQVSMCTGTESISSQSGEKHALCLLNRFRVLLVLGISKHCRVHRYELTLK